MYKSTCDFSCWVLKYDGRSIYGRIYQKDSLKNNDNILVPLCWDHIHYDPSSILGSALLEDRGDGIYVYCWLNNEDKKEDVMNLIRGKGTVSISPFVNSIKYDGHIITSGTIREVSLVVSRIDDNELYYPVINKEKKE